MGTALRVISLAVPAGNRTRCAKTAGNKFYRAIWPDAERPLYLRFDLAV